jgi:hypothetical protein
MSWRHLPISTASRPEKDGNGGFSAFIGAAIDRSCGRVTMFTRCGKP